MLLAIWLSSMKKGKTRIKIWELFVYWKFIWNVEWIKLTLTENIIGTSIIIDLKNYSLSHLNVCIIIFITIKPLFHTCPNNSWEHFRSHWCISASDAFFKEWEMTSPCFIHARLDVPPVFRNKDSVQTAVRKVWTIETFSIKPQSTGTIKSLNQRFRNCSYR